MYNTYYSSSDTQLYIASTDFTNIIKLDTTMAIGYSVRQSSTPIYSLGSRVPQFFSRGNTLGQGSFTIAFTDVEYLKACLMEIDTSDKVGYYLQTADTNTDNTTVSKKSNAEFKKQSANKNIQTLSADDRTISIGAIDPSFNLSIYMNNETAITASDSKVINLIGVKIIEEQNDTSSTKDSPLMVTYNFIFRDIERG